ncbi:DNA/RNA nuclease SfsA [Halobacillus sp. MO56]
MYIKTTRGRFLSECKNRFLCKVKVQEEEVECYVPSSSRLQNYLTLDECEVLLTANKSPKARTKYALFAVIHEGQFIILNLNKVNYIIENLIHASMLYSEHEYAIYREKLLDNNYKSDLYLISEKTNSDIIIEAKGIISDEENTVFPQVNSERSLEQLYKIRDLLKRGREVHYFLVSLSPVIKRVNFEEDSKYTKLLRECVDEGLKLKTLRLLYNGYKISHDESLKIGKL